jgi:hypothetical protein
VGKVMAEGPRLKAERKGWVVSFELSASSFNPYRTGQYALWT